jgi:CheY-like chemotaxis protein
MSERIAKLLMIEDDPVLISVYRRQFEQAGLQVEVVTDGQAGFYRLHEGRFDVLLLDLMLPNISGLEILQKLRAQKRFKDFPILVFTNAYLGQMGKEAARAGATRVLHKATTTPQQIIEVVQGILFLPTTAPAAEQPSSPAASDPAAPLLELVESGDAGAAPASQEVGPEPVLEPEPEPTPAAWAEAAARPIPIERPVAWPAADTPAPGTFVEEIRATLASLRDLFRALCEARDDAQRAQTLHDMYRRVRTLTGHAAVAGWRAVSQVSAAVEALLQELAETPAYLGPSTLHTLRQTVELAALLASQGAEAQPTESHGLQALVVDHEAMTRMTMVFAVENAHVRPVAVREGGLAQQLLEDNTFDLVILDADLPGTSGTELCALMRSQPNHQFVPVILAVSPAAFAGACAANTDPATDFVAKPIMMIELTVKVACAILRGRVHADARGC